MPSRLRLLVLAATLASPAFCAEDKYSVDWKKIQPEIFDYYSNLIHLDTSNPPGNETKAAEYLKSVFEKEGIPAQIFTLEPGRGNVVARLKGNGSKKPVLLMGHLDVVGVQKEKWTVDPFSALRKDGYVYGRGTIDDKDKVTSGLMTMLLLKRMNVPLDRDVIFLGEAGEEGTSNVGIGFMVDQHWDDIACEYAITEGGTTSGRNGRVRTVEIATTEKVPHPVRLVAHGSAGHGSRPRLDNPITHLVKAVWQLSVNQPPIRLNDTTRSYFERLAKISLPAEAERYNHIADPARQPAIQAYFAQHELTHYSILRTTVVPTIIQGGFRSNVIPSEAEATLDIRALPDEDMPKFYDWLKSLIGDSSIEIIPRGEGRPPGEPSRIDTEMFHSFEASQKEMYPSAITLPTMLTGATDNAQLRAKGVQAYGIGPIVDEHDAEGGGGAHGDDERLLEVALYKEVEFLWRSVVRVVAKN